jgi:hypothetical protein
MLMDFGDSTLYDPVSGKFFQAINTNDDASVNINNLGYQMRQNQSLICRDVVVETGSSGFSFCFWLYPSNPGQVKSPYSNDLKPLRMPIIIFSDTASDFEDVVLSVYENTNIDGTNKIELKITSYDEYGNTDNSYIAYSDPYTSSESHHFFFNISIEKNNIQIIIDGDESGLSDVSGILPDSFEYATLDVGINRIYEQNYSYNLSNNIAIIDDIGFFNIQFEPQSILPKLINEGLVEFADLDLRNKEDYLQSSLFNDPTTLKINAIIDDMSYVYLARNDGKILFGSPLLWESRRLFSDDRELNLLNELVITETLNDVVPSGAEIVNGFLKITDSIVRL